MQKLCRYIGCFAATVVLALLFLGLGTFIPQNRIDIHVRESSYRMMEEGEYPTIADYAWSSQLDNFTDAVILSESKAMSSRNFSSILTNPRYRLPDKAATPVDDLHAYAEGTITEPTGYYVRYWMGFRTIVRLLLVVLNYYSLKRYVAIALFTLMAAAICSVASRVSTKAAMAFAVSVILVKPYIVALSLQFSCCFFLAMSAMLLIPRFVEKPNMDGLVFMEIGMLTMFFDFYTVPIITFGMPYVYLYLLRAGNKDQRMGTAWKDTILSLVSWFVGYVGMWIARLALVSAFTDKAGFDNGINAFLKWMPHDPSSKVKAIREVLHVFCGDKYGFAILGLAVAVILFVWILAVIRKKIGISDLARHSNLLAVALIPFVWFLVASTPTYVHAWFQYRSMCLVIWAIGAYLLITTADAKETADLA